MKPLEYEKLVFEHDTFCEKNECEEDQVTWCYCLTRFYYVFSEDKHEYPSVENTLMLFQIMGKVGNVPELIKEYKEKQVAIKNLLLTFNMI